MSVTEPRAKPELRQSTRSPAETLRQAYENATGDVTKQPCKTSFADPLWRRSIGRQHAVLTSAVAQWLPHCEKAFMTSCVWLTPKALPNSQWARNWNGSAGWKYVETSPDSIGFSVRLSFDGSELSDRSSLSKSTQKIAGLYADSK